MPAALLSGSWQIGMSRRESLADDIMVSTICTLSIFGLRL
jgi:hypothetical protein